MVEERTADPKEFKRLPAKEMSLKEINESVKRVALLGSIVSKDEEELTAFFSDGSGEARLEFREAEQFNSLSEGLIVRVIGKPFFNNDAVIISVETVHEMKGLNPTLIEKVRLMEKKFLG